jgi:hypothetical protein
VGSVLRHRHRRTDVGEHAAALRRARSGTKATKATKFTKKNY